MMVGLQGIPSRGAALTFAMARHAVVDLIDLARLREVLTVGQIGLREGREADEQLSELRGMYEPYVNALSDHLLMPLPTWIPTLGLKDNWQKSKWK